MEEENRYFVKFVLNVTEEIYNGLSAVEGKLERSNDLVQKVTEDSGKISDEIAVVQRILQHSNDLTEQIIFYLQIITVLTSLLVVILCILICTNYKGRKKLFPFKSNHIPLEEKTNIMKHDSTEINIKNDFYGICS